jgi:hypothetical protein
LPSQDIPKKNWRYFVKYILCSTQLYVFALPNIKKLRKCLSPYLKLALAVPLGKHRNESNDGPEEEGSNNDEYI